MNSRRQLLLAVVAGAIAARTPAFAQGTTRVFRIGWVSLAAPGTPSQFLEAFRQGLKERGYVEGRNVVIEVRLAGNSRELADQMVTGLVQSKVDVIVTQGGAAWSAFRYGGTTPVVMGYSGDPVEAKFVDGLSRPGGTRTGISFLSLELVGKRLELLAQIVPGIARVAVIAHPEHPGEQNELRSSQSAAQNLGISLSYFPVRSKAELEAAFTSIASQPIQAVVVFPDALTLEHRDSIAAFGLKQRLPTVSGWSTFAESGVLVTYGPNLNDSYAHLASYVDKILKGAKPADLPVELPTSVEMAINMRTAKAIGIRPPQSVLVRADKVIE